ncbi:MAG: hypothetical protein ACR2Q3_13145 [Woeseiaceae bacterium]
MFKERSETQSDFWVWGGRFALIATLILFGLRAGLMDTGFGNLIEFLIGIAIGAVAIAAGLLIARLLGTAFESISATALTLFAAALLAVSFFDSFSTAMVLRTLLDPDAWRWPLDPAGPLGLASVITLVLAVGLSASVVMLIRHDGLDRMSTRARVSMFLLTGILVLAASLNIATLVDDGEDPYPSDYRTMDGQLPEHVAAPDPSLPGSFDVASLSYGAGENRRRPEFGVERDLESRTVDASPLLPEWKGVKKRMRERFWGFGLEEAPLNGLVWAPEGDGPFPLALIIHGNHGMEEYSDPGYAYLGELLASRGIIAVSIDENFINGTWSGDFQGKEMPARAWLLLEHLRLWREWNTTDRHRFAGRIDLDNIALIGHSRGGEAVSMAYAYNDLPNFPDDATVEFDYGFSIPALVAVAQIDKRYHRRVELEDVNFLALQGSYDSDESAFHGLRQFNRIELSDDAYRFKTGLYIHGANHGQFNSIWGREDSGPPGAWQLNLAPIISGEDQRQIAKVYIAGFLAATLQNDARYVSLFRDTRKGTDWLPDHAYVQQFTDSSFIALADFDEDLDVRTATASGASIHASGFSLWREEELKHRDEMPQGTSAVVLGWSADEEPVYTIDVPVDFWPDMTDQDYVLSLSVSASTETPPDDDDEETDNKDSTDRVAAPRFTIDAYAETGRTGRIDSVDHAQLAPPLKVRYLKPEDVSKKRYKADWEPVLQVFEVPLSTLTSGDIASIRQLRIRFDASEPGVVILDDIGIRHD